MITVRCPACDAAYQLDEAKLANGGRKLKCARCAVVWLAQVPKPETPRAEEETAADVPAPVAPVEESLPEEGTMNEGQAGDAATAEEDVPSPPVDMEPVPEPSVDEVVQVGGWRQWVRGPNLWRSGALGLVALGVLTGGGLLALKLMPEVEDGGAEEAVAATAMPAGRVVQPPKGIVLHSVRGDVDKMEDEKGGIALTVRGLLANTTSTTLVVPPMRLELLGEDGALADMWPVNGVSGQMGGGTEQAWTVSLSAPDMRRIKGWRVVFVDERDTLQRHESRD